MESENQFASPNYAAQ